MNHLSGIYQITCEPTGRQYIGSATSFKKRFAYHRWQLRRGTHHNRNLQRAWNKYGGAAFAFRPLLICAKADLIFYEQRAIDILMPAFNALLKAGSVLGLKWSAESRARHRETWQQKVAPTIDREAHKAKVRLAWAAGAYEQAMRGKSNTYEHEGRSYTAAEASATFGISAKTLKYRLAKGMSFAEAVALPLVVGGRRTKWIYEGEHHTLDEVSAKCGVKTATLRKRMWRGLSFEQAINLG